MHAHDLVAGSRKHAERVVVAQIDLGGEGQVGDVAVTAHLAGLQARLVELLAIEGHVGVGVLEHRAQTLDLQLAKLGGRQ